MCDSRTLAGFDHVRWIGGGTGAGKSTVTGRLAERFGLAVYGTDAAIGVHSAKLTAGRGAAARGVLSDEHGRAVGVA
jgi:dephospho-CoA kinase